MITLVRAGMAAQFVTSGERLSKGTPNQTTDCVKTPNFGIIDTLTC
jgi:hypothetical protein